MSLEDSSQAARACNALYSQTRDEVLRSHHWNFAISRQILSRLSDNPPFEWQYQYQLPEDFIRLVQLNGYGETEATRHYEISGTALLTNEGEAKIKYVRRATNTNTFDPLFVEALAVKLASKLALTLSGNRNLPGELLTEYERGTAPLARKVDAQEDRKRSKPPWADSAFVRSRRGAGILGDFRTTGPIVSPPEPGGGQGGGDTPTVPNYDFIANVMAFGAKGGGVDDYPAILKAYQAVVANGSGTIYFPAGRAYHVRTAGVHGLHINQKSRIKVEMGEGATLVMDNMIDGLAVSHGIYVQGPCEEITLINAHVRFATMAESRQTWAPFYFLGANVGVGDINGDGWYRGESGGERPDLIAAGAIRKVIMRGCFSENSPSVFVGLIGMDDYEITSFRGLNSWADGLYNRYFRNARINGVRMDRVGDDGISLGSEESNIALANIDNDFHGEGSYISNFSAQGGYPETTSTVPSGSVVLLGCRDLTVTNVTVIDKYRVFRVETGTETTGIYTNLNLNFLANKNVTVSNISSSDCAQGLCVISKEATLETDPKWWANSVRVSNFVHNGGELPFDSFGISGGTPSEGVPPPLMPPLVSGYWFDGFKATGYSSETATLGGLYQCRFENFELSGAMTFAGMIPYEGDPDGDYPDNFTAFFNIKARNILFQGLKRCHFDNIVSENAPVVGITFTTCADGVCDNLLAINANRSGDAFGCGVVIDLYSKRMGGNGITIDHDDQPMPDGFSINNAFDHKFRNVRVKTKLNQFYRMVSDAKFNTQKLSQVDRIDWYHGGEPVPQWRTKLFAYDRVTVIGDTADFTLYPDGAEHVCVISASALTANRTVYISEDAVGEGDEFTVLRDRGAGGPYSVTIAGKISSPPSTYAIATIPAGTFGFVRVKYDRGQGRYVCIEQTPVPIHPVSPDRGNVNVTLTAADLPVQYFGTTLTANRTITLPTSGVVNGDSFRIIRKAPGAFTLSIGGLISLAVNEWAVVRYNGTAWILEAFPGSGGGGGGSGDMLAANNLSDLVNKATSRTNLGVEIGVDVQAHSSNLDAWALLATSAKISATEKGANNGVASLDSGGKVPLSQLPSSIMEFKGTWNASTNSPTLADGTGDIGDVYIASTAGTQNLGSGAITFTVGDWVIYNGTTWQRVINSNLVASVNGQTGAVTLTKTDVGLGNCDNTSDANKPVSTAQATEINKAKIDALGFSVDGGGSIVTTGLKGVFTIDYPCTITGWTINTEGVSPTCTIDVWKIASGTANPTVINTITAAAKPALTTGNNAASGTLTGWTTSVAAGDIFGFNIDAVANATRLTFKLKVLK